MSIFNYSSPVWLFMRVKSLKKVENLKERAALQFFYCDYETLYEDILFKVDRFVGSVKRLKKLCIEFYKILHSLNPSPIKEIPEPEEVTGLDREKYKITFLSLRN